MKTELEEAAEKSAIEQMEAGNSAYILGFIQGVKHQQEQDKKLYSEEDMHKLMYEYQEWLVLTLEPVKPFKEWFEQFKKKQYGKDTNSRIC